MFDKEKKSGRDLDKGGHIIIWTFPRRFLLVPGERGGARLE